MKNNPTLNLVGEAWAIRPDYIARLTHNAQLLPPDTGRPSRNYAVINGVAVIPVTGVLEKDYSYFYGSSTSFAILQNWLRDAASREDVSAILLDVDSPGGTVAGTEETAALIREVRDSKPVVAYGSGMVASAAYWVASAASKLVISKTTEIGSIGVVALHVDMSGLEQAMGVKVTEITAGKYKRIASDHGPLTKDGKDYLQALIDTHYSLFVESVAANRGITTEEALAMADGKIFIGQDGLDIGLADSIDTFDNVLASLMNPEQMTEEENIMQITTAAELQAAYPALVQEIVDKALVWDRAEQEAKAQAEAGRQAGIKALCPAGLESVAQACITEGLTVEASAVRFLQAAKEQPKEEAKTPAPVNPALDINALVEDSPTPVSPEKEPLSEDAALEALIKKACQAVKSGQGFIA